MTDNNSQNFSDNFGNDSNTEGSETDPPGDEEEGGGKEDTNGPSLKEKISNFGLKHGKTINTVG